MNHFERVLVLGPHADDGEFGCGATMARLLEAGSQVHYAAFSMAVKSLPPGFLKDALQRELNAASHSLGILPANVHIFDFEVRTFPTYRQEILEIRIEPEVVDPQEVEMLEDLILAAVNEARERSKELMAQEVSKLTGGLQIPGLF